MNRKKFGLIFVFLGAAMWLQSFTYVAMNTAFLNGNTGAGIIESFLNSGKTGSLIVSLMCAALGIMLIKFDSLEEVF